MQYNFYFDIYAIIILVSIFMMSIVRRRIATYQNRVFTFLYIAVFIATVAERIETFLQLKAATIGALIYAEYIVGSCYYIFHLLSAACLMLYMMALLNINVVTVKNSIKVFAVFLIGTLLVIANLFTPILFYYSSDGSYHRADYQFLYYVLAAYYFISSFIMLISNKKVLHKRTFNYLSFYIVSILIGIIIQFFFPYLLVEEFFNTVSIVFAYIVLENPSEAIDMQTGFYSKKTFARDINLCVDRDFKNTVIFISVDVLSNYRLYSSQFSGEDFTNSISKYLERFTDNTRIYRFDDTIYALLMKNNEELKKNALLKTIAERLGKPWNVNGIAIDVHGFVWSMDYPKDYTTVSELISKVKTIDELYEFKGQNIISVDDIRFENEIIRRDFDNLVRSCLEKNTVKALFNMANGEGIEKYIDCIAFIPGLDGQLFSGLKYLSDKVDTKALSDTDILMVKRTVETLKSITEHSNSNCYFFTRISRTSLMKKGVINRILSIIAQNNIPEGHMMLRISETALSTIGDYGQKRLREISDNGIKLVIDRFGIGYSDTKKIEKLNVFGVVLDHELITISMDDEKYRQVVKSMVGMLHDISMYVFGEGIENSQEAAIVEEIGCDYGFGTYYGPFQTSEDLLDNLAKKE